MSVLAWLGTLAGMSVVGAPILARRPFRRFSPAVRAVLAGGAGASLVSFVMTLFALAGLRWSVVPVLTGSALVAAALSVLARGRPGAPEDNGSPGGGIAAVAAILSALCVLGALAVTLSGAATSIDLYLFWGPKAQQFALARGVDEAFLRDPIHGYMHAYYPPLVAHAGALASIAAGGFSWTGAILTFPLLLAALAAALPGILRGAATRDRSAAASALAVATIAVLGIRTLMAGNGDLPLLFFETLAMALLLRRDAEEPALLGLAGLLLGGAAATKVEGLVFAVAAAVLFGAQRRRSPREWLRVSSYLLLPSLAALGAWFAFGATRRLFAVYSEYGPFFAVHPANLFAIARGIPAALGRAGRGLPYAIPLLCLIASGRIGRRAWMTLGTAAALVAFLVFAYSHLSEDPGLWIAWSAPRVLAPLPVLFSLSVSVSEAESGPRRRTRVRLWLVAAALLCAFPLGMRLSRPLAGQLRLPATPIDETARDRARQWMFLDSCAPWLPPHASFTIVAKDPDEEMSLFMMAFGRYPGTYPMPHTYYRQPQPDDAAKARYVLRYGLPDPVEPGLRLVARVDGGAVYERTPPP